MTPLTSFLLLYIMSLIKNLLVGSGMLRPCVTTTIQKALARGLKHREIVTPPIMFYRLEHYRVEFWIRSDTYPICRDTIWILYSTS